MGKFDSVLDEVYGKQNTKLTSVLDEIYGPAVEPVTMEENAPTPIADTLVGLNRGIESVGEAITSPIKKLFTAPPNQDIVVPEELDMSSMQAARDRQAMLPPSMPAEEGYVPPAGITDALRVAPGLALDATGQMISGAIQQAQEVAPSMINQAYERFANADLGGVLPSEMRQKVAPIINIPQEDINAIAAVGQQAEENIKSKLQEARIQPGLNAPNIVANAASSVIQQAPIFAATALGGPVAGAAGLAAMGIGSMGARYQKARASGYTPEEAMLESGLYGLAEVIPEKLGMDAIFAAAKNPYATKSLVEGIKRLMVATGLSMTAEGLEETATQLAQNTIRKYARPNSERITEKPVESIAEGVPEAAVTGAVAGGAIGGGMNLVNQIVNRNNVEPPPPESPTATEPPPQKMEETARRIVVPQEPDARLDRIQPQFEREARPEMQPPTIDTFFKKNPRAKSGTVENVKPTLLLTNRFDFSGENDIDTLRSMLDDAVERENFQPGAESDAILQRIHEIENKAVDEIAPKLSKIIQQEGLSPEIAKKILAKAFLIERDGINNPQRMSDILNEFSGIESAIKKTAKILIEDKLKEIFPNKYVASHNIDEFFNNMSPLSSEAQTKIIKGAQAKAKAIHGRVKDYFENPVEERAAEPTTPSPQPQQATEVVAEDIKPQPVEQTPVKTPVTETTPEVGDTIQWNTPKVLGKTQTKTGTIVDKTADNRWTVSIDGQEFDFNPRKNTNIKVVEKYQQPAKTEQEQYVETRRAEIAQEQKVKEEARQKELQDLQSSVKTPEVKEPWNVETAQQNFNRIMNAQPYELTLEDYIYQKQQKAKVYRKPTGQRDRQEMKSRIREVGDRYAPGEHMNAVKAALTEGKPVPPEVLAEYPDLQPRPKSGPGMFGGATMQNLYEKGADKLFKMKKAYETSQRNADVTRDTGRVISITEIDGRPVEDEPPIRPRIGLFNLQNVYESVFGKPRQSDNRITIGDPKIGTKINDMYDRTEATRKNLDEQAEKKRPSTYATTKQSMIDVFMPYLDIVKNDSARYEQALSKLHDVFYIPSAVEGFLLDLRDEILTPVQKAGKTYRDYSAYRMAKWTLTGRAKVKSPLSLKEAQDFIDSIDAPTKKLFEDITTKFHERVWKNVLKEVESTGLKDDKTINFIMDKENYATFFPAKQMGLSYGSREYKPSGEIFKLTEEGYTGDIQDVLTSLTQKGIAMLTHANINAAKLEAFDILKTYSPNDITPAKQSMKGYTKIKDSNGNEIEIPIMEFDEPAPNSQMALLTARDKGKAVGYYVPKQFATSFDEALGSGEQLHDALRYFSNATQAIKNVWIDYNPPWQLFTNMIRDISAAMIEMPGFKKPVKFAGKVIRNAPAAIGDYIPVIGKALQIMTGYDRAKFDAQVKKMLKEKKLLSSKDVQQLGDYNISVFDRIQNAFDTFPREGESKKFLQQVKAFGKDVERLVKTAFDETLVESQEFTDDEIVNMTRRGGSPAFAVRGGGKAFNVATTGLVFYNAVKEGWRAGKYFYEKDPVGFVIKASIPLSIFSFGVAAVSGAFGDEWKKAYLAIKKSDRENKLTFPLWWEPDGQIKYIALSMPQFLKPFMTAINEFGSANARILEGMADAFSNEMPSLNPVFDIAKTLALYGQNKPPIDRFGNPIMTQDQWTAGGPDKAINMLKAISNQNLFGSIYRFPIKPSETKKDLFSLTSLYDATFGKILKTSFAPAMDTEKEEANAAKARLLMRQAIEVEKSDPAKYQKLRDEIRKLGVVPSRQFMRSVRRNLNIEREEEAGTITKREAYEKKLRSQPKEKRKKYNELFRK